MKTAACALFVILCQGCAMLQASARVDQAAADLSEQVDDALADGQVDQAETKQLDKASGRVAEALDEKRRAMATTPKTGFPWVDLAIELGKMTAIGAASVKATNVIRDRKRRKRGEQVEVRSA